MITLVLGLGLILAIVVMTAVVIVGHRGDPKATYLEWDPVATAAWKADVDDADVFDQLDLHNARRTEKGLEPRSMAEYEEAVRRRSRGR